MFRDTEAFSPQDEAFFQWLSLIQDPQQIRVAIDGNTVKIVCTEGYLAKRLWLNRHLLREARPLKLDLRVGEQQFIYAIGSIE